MKKKYETATAFRAALEERLKNQSRTTGNHGPNILKIAPRQKENFE